MTTRFHQKELDAILNIGRRRSGSKRKSNKSKSAPKRKSAKEAPIADGAAKKVKKSKTTAAEEVKDAVLIGEVAGKAAAEAGKDEKKKGGWDTLSDARKRDIHRIYQRSVRHANLTYDLVFEAQKKRQEILEMVSEERQQRLKLVWRKMRERDLQDVATNIADPNERVEKTVEIKEHYKKLKENLARIVKEVNSGEVLYLSAKDHQFIEHHSSRTAKNKDVFPAATLTSYICFAKLNRSGISEEAGVKAFGDVGKLVGHKWTNRSEEDKKNFVPIYEAQRLAHAERRKAFDLEVAQYCDSDADAPAAPEVAPPAAAAV